MTTFQTLSTTPLTPEQAFAYIVTLANWTSFTGYGPLPGIVEATAPGGTLSLGTRVRVRNTDGSVHHEVVVVFEPGQRYAVRMELSPPASWLMRHIDEEVVLSATPEGTTIRRRFDVVPRSILTAPLVAIIALVFLRTAVRRHDHVVAAALGTARQA